MDTSSAEGLGVCYLLNGSILPSRLGRPHHHLNLQYDGLAFSSREFQHQMFHN
jgi:hypothetical protein